MSRNVNYAIGDAGDIRLVRNSDGATVLYSPYANTTALNFTSSQLYAMAKGSKAVRFDNGKEGTMTASFEVFELKWLPIILGGSDWAEGVKELFVRYEFTIAESITLPSSPKVGSLSIFKLDDDNIGQKSEITVGTPATNPDEYSALDTALTFNTGDVGLKAVAYYMKDSAVTATSYSVPANEFPVAYTIDCVSSIRAKNDGVDEDIYLRINNARPISEFVINFSETEVTTLDVTFDLLPDSNDNLCEFTRP